MSSLRYNHPHLVEDLTEQAHHAKQVVPMRDDSPMTGADHDQSVAAAVVFIKVGACWLANWLADKIESLDLQQLVLFSTLVYTVLNTYFLWRDKRVQRKAENDRRATEPELLAVRVPGEPGGRASGHPE